MTDFDRLLAAIRENPGEDAPRLVWADWLEENAGTVECAACDGTRLVQHRSPRGANYDAMGSVENCPACRGTGRVSDGRAELAAFVRVQCELAARDDERCRCRECQPTGQHTNGPCRSPLKPLRRRERELWPAVRGAFEGEGWEVICENAVRNIPLEHVRLGYAIQEHNPLLIVRRGLPAVVRCTLAEWMGGECGQCQGRGHRTLYGDGSGPWTKCQYCVDGRTPGIGPRLAQRWPIVAVEVTNREPSDGSVTRWNGFAGGYGWFRVEVFPGNPNEREDLPKEVFDRLTGGQIIDKDTNWRVYDSEHAARAALSDALIAWARGQVIEETK